MIGRTLSHYKIVEKIGAGGMGEVYLAEDTELGRPVALKVLPDELAASEERRARFKREAKAIAALNHPNIVTLHSVEEADGVHFLTMELVRGKRLTELLAGEPLALDRFFEIAVPLADALASAHQHGITHRDLKPDNVMLSDEGRVKVLDFGLAKLGIDSASEGASELPTGTMTQEGHIVGTVSHMSPEQAEGKRVDHRTDIFSLGIVLFEMATGKRPFQGDSPVSVLSAILKETPTPVLELNAALPEELERIIHRCLEKDRELRYPLASDLKRDLEEVRRQVESGSRPRRRRRSPVPRSMDCRSGRGSCDRGRGLAPAASAERGRDEPASDVGAVPRGASVPESERRPGERVLQRWDDGRAHREALAHSRPESSVAELGQPLQGERPGRGRDCGGAGSGLRARRERPPCRRPRPGLGSVDRHLDRISPVDRHLRRGA